MISGCYFSTYSMRKPVPSYRTIIILMPVSTLTSSTSDCITII